MPAATPMPTIATMKIANFLSKFGFHACIILALFCLTGVLLFGLCFMLTLFEMTKPGDVLFILGTITALALITTFFSKPTAH